MSDVFYGTYGLAVNAARPYCAQLHWDITFGTTVATWVKLATTPTSGCKVGFDTSPSSNMANDSLQRIDIKQDGVYHVIMEYYIPNSVNPQTWQVIYKNASAEQYMTGQLPSFDGVNVMRSADAFMVLEDGDYLEAYIFLDNLNITCGSTNSELWNTFTVLFMGNELP